MEINSFVGHSDLDQFEDAVGQFMVYFHALAEQEAERELFPGRSERILFRWFKNQSTLDFLEAYDEEFNPHFKSIQMGAFKMEALKNSNTYSSFEKFYTKNSLSLPKIV